MEPPHASNLQTHCNNYHKTRASSLTLKQIFHDEDTIDGDHDNVDYE